MSTVHSFIDGPDAPILLIEKPLSRTFTPALPRPHAAPVAIGTKLGPWVIEAELGSGSMGQVYQARHERLGRRVALKVLRPELVGDEGLVERFLQEGRAVNQINHEHIVEVHDFVNQPGAVYCVMEFLEGETLARRMVRCPSTIESIRSMARQIASAIGASHAAGVVHRDLKPDNIFLVSREGRDDWVKVLDFGIAKCAGPNGQLSTVQTAQGSVLGTPRYMAPEQVAGLPSDARTDIYALGTILHELISGSTPFDGPSFGLIAADIINHAPPPLPDRTAAGEVVPAALAALIAACLSKQPVNRPASMADVEAALAQPAPALVSPPRKVRGNSRLTLTIGLGLAAVAYGMAAVPARPAVLTLVPAAALVVAAPEPAAAPEITLWVETEPQGALVSRLDSGEPLGRTPLEVTVDRASATVPLRIELAGYDALERAVSIEESQRLEYMLQAVPKAKVLVMRAPVAVTGGVVDPY